MEKLTFKIEQIAIVVPNARTAQLFLSNISTEQNWVNDFVKAEGRVYGKAGGNEAHLSFNYGLGENLEFEILDYHSGPNWMGDATGVSHFGMHVTPVELEYWREFKIVRADKE